MIFRGEWVHDIDGGHRFSSFFGGNRERIIPHGFFLGFVFFVFGCGAKDIAGMLKVPYVEAHPFMRLIVIS